MKDLWWDDEFLKFNFEFENVLRSGSIVLPFQAMPESVRVGFIGAYSLAYTPDIPINPKSLKDIWLDLRRKFPDRELQVRLPPELYHQDLFKANFETLCGLGARILYQDLNFHLDLTGNFLDSINRNRSREMKKRSLRNFMFLETSLEDAYGVITSNRIGKGLKPSLSREKLIQLHSLYPNRVRFHGVKQEGQVVSSSISMVINPRLTYVFMWGHDPSIPTSAESISTLCEGLFNNFKGEGVQFLCLGTASVQGIVDQGLNTFKSSLGAIKTSRVTMGIPRGL